MWMALVLVLRAASWAEQKGINHQPFLLLLPDCSLSFPQDAPHSQTVSQDKPLTLKLLLSKQWEK